MWVSISGKESGMRQGERKADGGNMSGETMKAQDGPYPNPDPTSRQREGPKRK